jgi:hypothetical protein
MADYDVSAQGLSVPPAAAVVTTYRPAISVRNNGLFDALATGYIRIYSAGRLVFESDVYSPTIAPAQTRDATADSYWTPVKGTYTVQGYVTCARDQVEPNNNLHPVTIVVSGAQPPEPPVVTAHAAQHEEGGEDELSIDGLTGRAADPQTPFDHASNHEPGGPDALDVTGMPGILAQPQLAAAHAPSHSPGGADPISGVTPSAHAATHAPAGTDVLSIAGLAGLAADPQTPADHGNEHHSATFAALDLNGLLPSENLAEGTPPEGAFLSAERTWLLPPGGTPSPHAVTHQPGGDDPIGAQDPAPHAVTHQPGGDDPIGAQDPAPHAAMHEASGDDPISIAGLSGVTADAQTPVTHASRHQHDGDDPLNVYNLSGSLADPQEPTEHGGTHSSIGTDPVNIGGLSGVPYCVGQASGAATLDEDSMVPTAQLGGEAATSSTFLRGDRSWATPDAVPAAHAATHQPAGDDPIGAQAPANHGATHGNEGGDDISIGGLSGMPAAAGVALGLATLDIEGKLASGQTPAGLELTANKGAANGYAPLDADSKVPETNLPSFAAQNFSRGDHIEQAVEVVFDPLSNTGKILNAWYYSNYYGMVIGPLHIKHTATLKLSAAQPGILLLCPGYANERMPFNYLAGVTFIKVVIEATFYTVGVTGFWRWSAVIRSSNQDLSSPIFVADQDMSPSAMHEVAIEMRRSDVTLVVEAINGEIIWTKSSP